MPKLTKKAIRFGRTDGRTDPNYSKALLLIITEKLRFKKNKLYLYTRIVGLST